MAVTGLDDDADATKCTGDPEADAGRGEVTLTSANEAAVITKITNTLAVTFLTTLLPPLGCKVCGQSFFVLKFGKGYMIVSKKTI